MTIFLASSFELQEDIEAIRLFIAAKNDMLNEKGVYLKLVTWEDSNAIVPDGLQSKYNEAIKQCDVIFFLFWRKAGKYTLEEFAVAYEQFQATGKPHIVTYFKDTKERTPELIAFQEQLGSEKHFYTRYENKQDLCNQIYDQLEKLGYLINSHGRPLPQAPKPPSNFVGRDDLLIEIHQQLAEHNRLVLVNGLGGIGKTAMAQKYVERYRAEYNSVVWIFIQNGLVQDMVTILQASIQMDFTANIPADHKLEYLMMALGDYYEGNNLLVVDNANDADELLHLVVHLEACGWATLITSRCIPDAEEYEIVRVDELPESDAMLLFRGHYPLEADGVELRVLLEKIYYHTLLIELVAKAGKKKNFTIGQLVERLDGGLAHQDLQRNIGSHSHKVSKKARLHEYIVAMFEPEDLDANQQGILRYFSVLPAVDIPLEHFKRLFAVEDENGFEDDLDYLFQYGWLSRKDTSYKMHGLVQDVMFTKLEANLESCKKLILTLNGIMESKDGFLLDLNKAWDYQEYAQSVVLKFKESDTNIGVLNFYLADFYINIGNLEPALTSITRASEHFTQCDDKEHLVASYECIGSIHQTFGQIDTALKFFELDIKLTKELYKSNPKSESLKNGLAISYEKLGNIHQALGQVDKALEFFELSMELMKELYESSPKNVEVKNNLAISYRALAVIYQSKMSFYTFAFKRYNQPVLALHEKSINLWHELYETTKLDSHKQNVEYAAQEYLKAKVATYAPIIQLVIMLIFANFYILNWISGWWLIGLVVFFWPMRRSTTKKMWMIKLPILGLVGLAAWLIV